MAEKNLALVINTTRPRKRRIDPNHMRRLVLTYNIPYCTTLAAARASASAIRAISLESIGVRALQDIHAGLGENP